jgi:gamma-glutamylcysteine synthetase
LLHTAGIEEAAMLVIAIDNRDTSVELTKYVKHSYPQVKVLARAFDRGHGYLLRQAGADVVELETYHSALELGAHAMRQLDYHPFMVEKQKSAYKRVEDKKSDTLYHAWEDDSEGERFDNNYRKLFMHLEEQIKLAIQSDRTDRHQTLDREWTPPPRDYADKIDHS